LDHVAAPVVSTRERCLSARSVPGTAIPLRQRWTGRMDHPRRAGAPPRSRHRGARPRRLAALAHARAAGRAVLRAGARLGLRGPAAAPRRLGSLGQAAALGPSRRRPPVVRRPPPRDAGDLPPWRSGLAGSRRVARRGPGAGRALRRHRARPGAALGAVASAAMSERAYMLRALRLAARARGRTAPNPTVGCVLVERGRVVGEGYHRKAGLPHAEVEALRVAGRAARGATAYVTLEPCNHTGRTGPCSEALIEAGVTRVVAAMADPNPKVDGG